MFCHCVIVIFFFCKQKTAYDMRISDWSSDVCSSDLLHAEARCGLAVILRIEAVDFGAEFHPSHVAQAHDGPAFGGAQADVAELLRRLQARLDRDGCVELLFLGRRTDRKSGVEGKSVSGRVDLGGRRVIKKKIKNVKKYDK